jgi:hypothetical protein
MLDVCGVCKLTSICKYKEEMNKLQKGIREATYEHDGKILYIQDATFIEPIRPICRYVQSQGLALRKEMKV